ncbi:alpha-amylase family glycosyl hydrolase [Pseudaquabacterium pictum]|uniref:Alpha-amylase n=1 Tax=Pseudaquabacterium pictum TaxID=2315236 RepID=A0A480AWA3_9BURK|nr:alpha-amylase family glycosyl hydrolase [Rubrivivax pictus]GCL63068.1 alpha-amylase [Rubrivivax pictus]
MNRLRPGAWLGAALTAITLHATAQAPGLKLHVPSPDWRDQVIYFVLTDRFDDGNPRNNDQGLGEYDPRQSHTYSGGDLAGLQRRLDYVQALGATALWLTPPVLNQWHDATHGFYGYHGYWASHFKRMDPHVGTLAEYQRLSDALHRRGMYLVQDVVVNHTGNFFSHGPGWRADDPAADYRPNTGSRPQRRPLQPPFHLNDPRRAADRAAGIYHWTPEIRDVTVRREELDFQTSGLDDLNTENPRVRRALRDSFGWWIRSVGVDAFRIDTAYHVPPEFFEDFLYADDRQAPGMARVAERTGRRDFLAFGEGFGIDAPGQTRYTRKLESYIRGDDGRARLGGMLNFPLYAGLVDVFARGRPATDLQRRVQDMVAADARGIDPRRLPTFIDNHDVDRWLAVSGEAAMKQALLAMMTLPGIPVLYYGTEQGLVAQRASMFAAGWGSGGRDRFDTASPLFRYTQSVVALRQANRGFSRALPQVLQASGAGPGVLAWRTAHDGQVRLVVFNTADTPRFVDNLPVGPAQARLRRLFDIHGDAPATLAADAGGQVHLRLPARSGTVWAVEPATDGPAVSAEEAPRLDPLPAEPMTGDFSLTGQARPGTELALIVDGDESRAQRVHAGADGRFTARIDTRRMSDPALAHRVVLRTLDGSRVSNALSFRMALPWQTLADVPQPLQAGGGPTGSYRYPTHESFTQQMDLRRTRVLAAGGALRIELDMADLTSVWAPANGFDHVAFSIFVELPGRAGGARVMPGQNAELPDGMHWHLRLRSHGWSNALFGPEGASATADGRSITPAAAIHTDAAQRRVVFTLPSEALGDPASFSGARVFVTTWDWDGTWRPLAPEAGSFTMGGGMADGPKVWSASPVIRLP